MESDGSNDKNSRSSNVFFAEKRAIYDLVSAQETLVNNLNNQKKQLSGQVAVLSESIAR
jgi:hypothetical protein